MAINACKYPTVSKNSSGSLPANANAVAQDAVMMTTANATKVDFIFGVISKFGQCAHL